MENLAKAIIAVMQDVKGIEKSQTVGTGAMSYKGVPDQEVKKIIGESMTRNGLCILPIDIQPKTQIDRWEENVTYNGQTQVKQKQQVFTEVTTKYLLLHTSGESQVLSGYGQGTDSQDKSAGKASTYALKYTLLYTFLVPTGKIDDADNTHSDDIPVKPVQAKALPNVATTTPIVHPVLEDGSTKFLTIVEGLVDGIATMEKVKAKNTITPEVERALNAAVKVIQAERLQKAS